MRLTTGIYQTPNGWGWHHGACKAQREIYFGAEAALDALLRHVRACGKERE
jgi:hypothetical protein